MKEIFRASILSLFLCVVGLGQTKTTRVEARPVGTPFEMTNSQFENLEYPASIDRIGKISDKDKKTHLDMFASILSEHNQTVEYLILLNGLTRQAVGANMEFVYAYLTENKKIVPSRISFALTAKAENEMELWLIPNKNLRIPGCVDCVIIAGENREKLKEFFNVKKSN